MRRNGAHRAAAGVFRMARARGGGAPLPAVRGPGRRRLAVTSRPVRGASRHPRRRRMAPRVIGEARIVAGGGGRRCGAGVVGTRAAEGVARAARAAPTAGSPAVPHGVGDVPSVIAIPDAGGPGSSGRHRRAGQGPAARRTRAKRRGCPPAGGSWRSTTARHRSGSRPAARARALDIISGVSPGRGRTSITRPWEGGQDRPRRPGRGHSKGHPAEGEGAGAAEHGRCRRGGAAHLIVYLSEIPTASSSVPFKPSNYTQK